MKIMKAVFIFMLDGNQMFQMSINDKRFLVMWNSLLKVLNGKAMQFLNPWASRATASFSVPQQILFTWLKSRFLDHKALATFSGLLAYSLKVDPAPVILSEQS